MKYNINSNNNTFFVKENATGYIVFATENKEEALTKQSFYNTGGGFDGYTPEFIIKNKG